MNAINRAEALHRAHTVIDAHFDLGAIVYGRRFYGESDILKRHFYESFRAGGLTAVVAAIYIDDRFLPEMGLRLALGQIEALTEEVEANGDWCMPVRSASDFQEAKRQGKVGVVLSLEGVDPIGKDIDMLSVFYRLGVRGVGLTWSRRNYAADGSYFGSPPEGIRGGLTPFGIELVKRAEALGMFLDVSHLNDEGVSDVFKYTERCSVIASHSNTRALHPIPRNLTDEQIRMIAARGGVIGLNGYMSLVHPDPEKQTFGMLCDHMEHMVSLVGYDHIGYGFDICEPFYENTKMCDVVKGHQNSIHLTAEMLKRGHAESEVVKMIGGNFERILNAI